MLAFAPRHGRAVCIAKRERHRLTVQALSCSTARNMSKRRGRWANYFTKECQGDVARMIQLGRSVA